MSDFLTNLAARLLAAPTLRPRTLSRFESEPNASPWATPSPEVAERDAEPAAPHTTRRAVATPTADVGDDPQPETEPPRRVRRAPDRDERGAERTHRAALPESYPQTIALPPHAAPEPRAERIETRHETNIASHTLQTTERVTERVIDRVREQHDTTIRIEAPPSADDADASPAAAAPRHRHDEQPPRIARETRQPSTMAVPREPRPSPRQAHAETSQSSEPIIHVSIGRVEVRAVTPAPVPQRTRTRNAPMTIEDYAARRNAKGRP